MRSGAESSNRKHCNEFSENSVAFIYPIIDFIMNQLVFSTMDCTYYITSQHTLNRKHIRSKPPHTVAYHSSNVLRDVNNNTQNRTRTRRTQHETEFVRGRSQSAGSQRADADRRAWRQQRQQRGRQPDTGRSVQTGTVCARLFGCKIYSFYWETGFNVYGCLFRCVCVCVFADISAA